MNKTSIIGIDLAKSVFQVHGMTSSSKQTFTRKFKREELTSFIAKQPKCLIGIEACSGSHHWAGVFEGLGHEVKILHPQYVKGYVLVNKNDKRDAEAIAEAASRERAPTVARKTPEQLALQAVHRVREEVVCSRTRLSNQMRGLLAEYGVVMKRGHSAIREKLPLILEDATNGLPHEMRVLINELREEWFRLEQRIDKYTKRIERIAKRDTRCVQLMSLPGVGPIIATLLLAYMGNGTAFKSSRNLSASIGLVPGQHSSGGKEVLLGISKRGNKQLRKQLIHGARSAYRSLEKQPENSRLGQWVAKLKASGKHVNKIVVALANKLARIAWSCIVNDTSYRAM
jgi:transposase